VSADPIAAPPIQAISAARLRDRVASTAHAEIFAFEPGWVIKLYRDHVPRADILRQQRIDQRLAATGLRVPRVRAELVEDIGRGRLGIVYERIDAETMTQRLRRRPAALLAQAERLAALHLEVHAAPAIDGLPGSKQRLARRIAMLGMLDAGTRARLAALLASLADGTSLCHGDFHSDNVLLAAPPVLIDWNDASIGTGLGDAARTWVIFCFTLPRLTGAAGLYARLFAAAYLRAYRRGSRCDPRELHAWQIVHAAARLAETASPTEQRAMMDFVRRGLQRL
jgi:aminoglycoside phosphotransferase (APT) family kinase protein